MPPKNDGKQPQESLSQVKNTMAPNLSKRAESPDPEIFIWRSLEAIAVTLNKIDKSQNRLAQTLAQQRTESQDSIQNLINRMEQAPPIRQGVEQQVVDGENFNVLLPYPALNLAEMVANNNEEVNNAYSSSVAYVPPHVRNGNGIRNDNSRHPQQRPPQAAVPIPNSPVEAQGKVN
ncbi:hypothetical protein CCACVL1_19140 [Corchorus capsularis]|uniref:Uncharacterized protein n=1 Tax=Corchorus capsularis TaxID=210143 RepID=A0A1R3HIA3_COCAP|nr:hypothetical protein CCACVL1_19140 [Corchorus capsularis]